MKSPSRHDPLAPLWDELDAEEAKGELVIDEECDGEDEIDSSGRWQELFGNFSWRCGGATNSGIAGPLPARGVDLDGSVSPRTASLAFVPDDGGELGGRSDGVGPHIPHYLTVV